MNKGAHYNFRQKNNCNSSAEIVSEVDLDYKECDILGVHLMYFANQVSDVFLNYSGLYRFTFMLCYRK